MLGGTGAAKKEIEPNGVLVSDRAGLANVGAVSHLVLTEGADAGVIHAVGCEDSYVRLGD